MVNPIILSTFAPKLETMQIGLTYTSTMVVTESMLAQTVGSGDLPVLATPMMMALMENAAMMAVAGELDSTESTVGGQIESTHLRPSALGATIRAKAELTGVEGRKLLFHIEAWDGDTLIGEGTHTRFIINREKFLAKL